MGGWILGNKSGPSLSELCGLENILRKSDSNQRLLFLHDMVYKPWNLTLNQFDCISQVFFLCVYVFVSSA